MQSFAFFLHALSLCSSSEVELFMIIVLLLLLIGPPLMPF